MLSLGKVIVKKFVDWRNRRATDELAAATVEYALSSAAVRLQRRLSREEQVLVVEAVGAWFEADEKNFDRFLDNPGRCIELVLSEIA